MRRVIPVLLGLVVLLSCQKRYDAPIPDVKNWEPFYSSAAKPLSGITLTEHLQQVGAHQLLDSLRHGSPFTFA